MREPRTKSQDPGRHKKFLLAPGSRFLDRGFLLMEALILILILSISFVSFIGVLFQALKISSRTHDFTEGLSRYEGLVFEIQNGLRPDLATYGGRGTLEEGYGYEIKPSYVIASEAKQSQGLEIASSAYGLLAMTLAWKQGREALVFNFFVSQRALNE